MQPFLLPIWTSPQFLMHPPYCQMAHSPYRNVFDCVGKMARSEGLGGFYKSYRTTLVREGRCV